MSYLLLIDDGRVEKAQQQNVTRIETRRPMIIYGPFANKPCACSVVTFCSYFASAFAFGGIGGGPTCGPQLIVLVPPCWCVAKGPATVGSDCEIAAFFSMAAACTDRFLSLIHI